MATTKDLIAQNLTPKLSSTANVVFPTSLAEFEKVFGNWSNYNLKLPAVLVQATTESDVVAAVSSQILLEMVRETAKIKLQSVQICTFQQYPIFGQGRGCE
jgi:subtilase family serine protease